MYYDTYNCAKQSLLDNFFLITHNIFQKTLLFCKKKSLKKKFTFFLQIYTDLQIEKSTCNFFLKSKSYWTVIYLSCAFLIKISLFELLWVVNPKKQQNGLRYAQDGWYEIFQNDSHLIIYIDPYERHAMN